MKFQIPSVHWQSVGKPWVRANTFSLLILYVVAAAILGGYSSLIGLAVLRSKMKSKPEPVVVETVTVSETPATDSGIPPVDSPEFDNYLDSKGFFMLLANDSQLTELTNSL